MQKYLKFSIILSILLFVALYILASLTDSLSIIKDANPLFFLLACLFFLLSITFWIISWAYLLKKKSKKTLFSWLIIGFSCVYGALTPIQIGTEALRSIKAKDIFNISYSESISSSMIVKGIKFFFLGFLSAIIFGWILVETELSAIMFFGLLSGFIVIVLATLLFLLPLKKDVGLSIAKLFGKLSKKIKKFKVLEKYFISYSEYLQKVSLKKFVFVFILSGLSFLTEFIALWFCFLSLNLLIGFFPLIFLFIIISILERTPILPRGIGLVEAAGFILLSIPEFTNLSLTISEIGAILILFDIVRLLFPTIISLIVSAFASKFMRIEKK
jgi:uncharacterized protein (TIRG00374 family)